MKMNFRAWDAFYNKMMYSSKGNLSGFFHAVEQRKEGEAPVMQSSGFYDPKLKEIYDGDILLYKKEIVMVGFKNSKKNDNFEFKKRKNPRVEMHYWEVFMSPKGQWLVRRGDVNQSLLKAAENHTVAGNIYETPELLKENV